MATSHVVSPDTRGALPEAYGVSLEHCRSPIEISEDLIGKVGLEEQTLLPALLAKVAQNESGWIQAGQINGHFEQAREQQGQMNNSQQHGQPDDAAHADRELPPLPPDSPHVSRRLQLPKIGQSQSSKVGKVRKVALRRVRSLPTEGNTDHHPRDEDVVRPKRKSWRKRFVSKLASFKEKDDSIPPITGSVSWDDRVNDGEGKGDVVAQEGAVAFRVMHGETRRPQYISYSSDEDEEDVEEILPGQAGKRFATPLTRAASPLLKFVLRGVPAVRRLSDPESQTGGDPASVGADPAVATPIETSPISTDVPSHRRALSLPSSHAVSPTHTSSEPQSASKIRRRASFLNPASTIVQYLLPNGSNVLSKQKSNIEEPYHFNDEDVSLFMDPGAPGFKSPGLAPSPRTQMFDDLPPVNLLDREDTTTILLTRRLAHAIRPYLPHHSQLLRSWRLLYSLDQHGISINTLYQNIAESLRHESVGIRGCLMVVRCTEGKVFGVYGSEPFRCTHSFYGNGETFLWKWVSNDDPTKHDPDDLNKKNDAGVIKAWDLNGRAPSLPDEDPVRVYNWTGINDYFMLTDPGCLAFGSGDGHFGLFIDQELDNGTSSRCPTFENDLISGGPKFQVLDMEVWGFVDA